MSFKKRNPRNPFREGKRIANEMKTKKKTVVKRDAYGNPIGVEQRDLPKVDYSKQVAKDAFADGVRVGYMNCNSDHAASFKATKENLTGDQILAMYGKK